jgi:hypothetical protein
VDEPKYVPSETEIQMACQRIQADWKEAEFLKRAGVDPEVPRAAIPRLPDTHRHRRSPRQE